VWDGKGMGMGLESLEWEVTAVWPGIYCVVNSLIPLENVNIAIPLHSSHGDDLPYMPHSSIDPGAGAITPYRAAPTIVKREIPAGGELFKNYGDTWFVTREDIFGANVPLSESFDEAQDLLYRYDDLDFSPLYDTILGIREVYKNSSRVLNALPLNEDDLRLALEEDIGQIYQKNATRSLEWLRKQGTCVDHIVHMPSTIAGAGEGAFAKRRLPNGTVITGSPLWTIENEHYFDLAGLFTDNDDGGVGESNRSHRKQILYNYCFGHDEIDLLFAPYAAFGALFINHGSGQKANVGVQWAKPGTLRHDPSLFELSPHQVVEKIKLGPQLGIEYIALNDIEKGEELFLDYGKKWEDAWDTHVKNWRPVKGATIASDWNRAFVEPVRTKDEELRNPYPASIVVRCHTGLLFEEESTWTQWELIRYGNYGVECLDVYGLPCEILERSPNNSTYKVSINTDKLMMLDVPESLYNSDGEIVLDNVPREAIFFLDAPHQSDLFLENAFRFTIQLPDEMVPEAWKTHRRNPPTEEGRDEL
jgi:hypothetical protein